MHTAWKNDLDADVREGVRTSVFVKMVKMEFQEIQSFFSEYIVCKTVKFFNKSQVLHNKTLFRVNCVS